jgi:hypothetical protein
VASHEFRFSLWAICTAITLTGCDAIGGAPESPGGLGAPPASRAAPAAGVGVYVTQANGSENGVIYGYRAMNKSNRAPICSIGSQSFDHSQIAVDAPGDVYSPNLASGNIDIYGPNCGSLIASVNDLYGSDVDVALGTSGTFYGVGGTHVSVCTRSGCSSELTDSSIKQLETAVVDKGGSVWASYYNQSGVPSLIVWIAGSMPGVIMSGYANQNTPGDLMFDKRGRLVSLQTLFNHVYVYQCDASEAICFKPKTFTLKASSLFGSLNAAGTDFQATDYADDSVDVYSYPKLKYKYSYSNGLSPSYSVQGIAQMP